MKFYKQFKYWLKSKNETSYKALRHFTEKPFEVYTRLPNFTGIVQRGFIAIPCVFLASVIIYLLLKPQSQEKLGLIKFFLVFLMIVEVTHFTLWGLVHSFFLIRKVTSYAERKWRAIYSALLNTVLSVFSIIGLYLFFHSSEINLTDKLQWNIILYVCTIFVASLGILVTLAIDIWLLADKVFIQPLPPQKPIKRIALIIGNDNYTQRVKKPYKTLGNQPLNDVQALEKCFKQELNVEKVIAVTNLDTTQFGELLLKFKHEAEIGEYNEVLFYYSGHGGSSTTKTYFVPIEATIPEDHIELKIALYPFKYFLEVFGELKNATHLHAFIDACRNNPVIHESMKDTASIKETINPLQKGTPAPPIKPFSTYKTDDEYVNALYNKGKKVFLLFSSVKYEKSFLGSSDKSPFAEAITEHLKKGISRKDLVEKVISKTKELSPTKQEPEPNDRGEDSYIY